ncbi:protein croquemort-like [Limulus polyphemus]|uniref:Scavenger receptor class B member 1 n=1 Tax=Limulus polyphemus TaxID=6850 RepID=A0ABM1SAH5_LIMPO|nr:protein croquemort-like [Limulus polyphemus]
MSASPTVKFALLFGIGASMAVMSIVMYFVFPVVMKSEIEKRMKIKEGSESYGYWKEPPIPIYIRFYFFNLVNPEGVWSLTEKPNFKEMGPYTFREHRVKVNLTWNDNGTVSYRQIKSWHFQPDLTNGSLDDVVTTLNVPAVAASNIYRYAPEIFYRYAIDQMLNLTHSSWFVGKPVRQLLFEGYNDSLIDESRSLSPLPHEKFGWFYGKNNSDDNFYNIFTGENGINKLGQIDKWNGSEYRDIRPVIFIVVRVWESTCNKINGTTGDMWPPFRSSSDHDLTMFVTDICRSITLKFHEETQVKQVKAYRYLAEKTMLDNGEEDRDNRCFCLSDATRCLPRGGLNVSSCQFNAPAVVTYPHFLYADPAYATTVDGMKADPEKHQMFVDIQPDMGIPMNIAARMQINIVFERVKDMSFFQNITSRIYFPIFWFSETAQLDESMAKQLHLVTDDLPTYSTIFCFVLFVTGGIVFTSGLLIFMRHRKIKEQKKSYKKVRT